MPPLTTFADLPCHPDESPFAGATCPDKVTSSCGDRGGSPPDRAGTGGVMSTGGSAGGQPPNKLSFGDNLHWLPTLSEESVDLIYLDPPFNSKAAYHLLYKSPDRLTATAQYQAFVDSWSWGPAADAAFAKVMVSGTPAAGIISALQNFMQKSDLMAYLTMMAARLIELHRVLSPKGSLFLHCDPTASHYLKIILDAIFGDGTFRNEIVWRRSHAHSDSKQGAKHFGRVTDTILFYAKTDESTWNTLHAPYDEKYIERDYRRIDENGRRYRIDNLQGPGGAEKGNPFYEVMGVKRYWRYSKEKMDELIKQGRIIQTRPGAVPQYKRYLDEMPGVPIQSLWTDLPGINNRSKEMIGYPTQKPLALLERIISAASNPGDVVLDPFCGCGTAVEAAHKLSRKWIGIDITPLAIDVIERRLSRLGLRRNIDFRVEGFPVDLDGARRLFAESPHDFQLWSLTLVDGQPRDGGKKGADKGVDGLIFFQDDAQGTVGQAIISVKGGENIHAEHVRDLLGTIQSHHAKHGILVTLHEPTNAMVRAAKEAESVESGGKLRPRIQICTIEALLEGRKPNLPPIHDIISAASAARRVKAPPRQPTAEEIREAPQFKYPIPGGKKSDQKSLPIDEPLLVQQPAMPTGRGRRRPRSA